MVVVRARVLATCSVLTALALALAMPAPGATPPADGIYRAASPDPVSPDLTASADLVGLRAQYDTGHGGLTAVATFRGPVQDDGDTTLGVLFGLRDASGRCRPPYVALNGLVTTRREGAAYVITDATGREPVADGQVDREVRGRQVSLGLLAPEILGRPLTCVQARTVSLSRRATLDVLDRPVDLLG